MSFQNTRGRYASFGIVSTLDAEVIDLFWYTIDNFLKGVFTLDEVIRFKTANRNGFLTLEFHDSKQGLQISFDYPYRFDPYFPREIFVVDKDGYETIILPDEIMGY